MSTETGLRELPSAGPKRRDHLAVLETGVSFFTAAVGPLALCSYPAFFPETGLRLLENKGFLVFVRLLLRAPLLVFVV